MGDITYLSKLLGLRSQVDALYVRAMGMQAENMARHSRGETIAYPDTEFNYLADSMERLSVQILQT